MLDQEITNDSGRTALRLRFSQLDGDAASSDVRASGCGPDELRPNIHAASRNANAKPDQSFDQPDRAGSHEFGAGNFGKEPDTHDAQ